MTWEPIVAAEQVFDRIESLQEYASSLELKLRRLEQELETVRQHVGARAEQLEKVTIERDQLLENVEYLTSEAIQFEEARHEMAGEIEELQIQLDQALSLITVPGQSTGTVYDHPSEHANNRVDDLLALSSNILVEIRNLARTQDQTLRDLLALSTRFDVIEQHIAHPVHHPRVPEGHDEAGEQNQPIGSKVARPPVTEPPTEIRSDKPAREIETANPARNGKRASLPMSKDLLPVNYIAELNQRFESGDRSAEVVCFGEVRTMLGDVMPDVPTEQLTLIISFIAERIGTEFRIDSLQSLLQELGKANVRPDRLLSKLVGLMGRDEVPSLPDPISSIGMAFGPLKH